MGDSVHPSATVRNSQYSNVKIYRNAYIADSILADNVSIGDDTTVERCVFEKNVTINRRSYINDSTIGMYTYAGINTTINWTKIGKFCSLARNIDIGGFDHDYRKVTTMPMSRFSQMLNRSEIGKEERHEEYCIIGNDVWIAAGAQILHKVKIGDGAVVGAGAVVTHDVEPYSIVAGIPARVIGYRCKEEWIGQLLKIRWWDWPEEVIIDNIEMLINSDISDEILERMLEISSDI